MRVKIITLYLLLAVLIAPFQIVSALPRVDVQKDQVIFDFPNTATFSATLNADADITSVTLEYGDQQQTCGDVTAKAYPQFAPGKTVQAEWTWDMRQSGSLPPGTQIWWRWRYTDSNGVEFVSEKKSATWLDDVHDWQTLTGDNLRVHWYGKDQAFGQTMLNAGIEGLRRNKDQAGLTTDTAIDLYIYPNYDDMKEAILFEPSWTGGMAFVEHNIFIMGISNSDSNWDQNTVIHELTHVLIGHFTFSCIGTVPTWLNEGLAMFSEGKLDAQSKAQLDQAISNNTLLSVRSLNGGFSELPDKANLSYSQSQSIVSFLIATYGQEKMTQLLGELRDAKPIDDALLDIYGFDTDGLEDAWRKSVDAAPRSASAQPTAQPTPTYVPTYAPVSGAPLAVTPTPYAVPTSSLDGSNVPLTETSPISDSGFLTLTVVLLCCCCLVLVFGIFIVVFIVRKNNAKSKGENNA